VFEILFAPLFKLNLARARGTSSLEGVGSGALLLPSVPRTRGAFACADERLVARLWSITGFESENNGSLRNSYEGFEPRPAGGSTLRSEAVVLYELLEEFFECKGWIEDDREGKDTVTVVAFDCTCILSCTPVPAAAFAIVSTLGNAGLVISLNFGFCLTDSLFAFATIVLKFKLLLNEDFAPITGGDGDGAGVAIKWAKDAVRGVGKGLFAMFLLFAVMVLSSASFPFPFFDFSSELLSRTHSDASVG
jgi:hypothetical protein